ncbi:MAG: hypothetical protein HZB16_20580 [Armatimonadetes bacterium]|nr:hypothetical protein [Armatimonadota bacterium]
MGPRGELRAMRHLSPVVLLFGVALAQAAPTLRVSDALPVLGQAVHLGTDADQPATIALGDETGTRDLGVVAAGQTLDWTPTRLGQVTLTARVGEQRSPSRTLFVTPRRLHFNYWSCPPTQKWVTSKLLGRGERAEDWLARGVWPLAWKYGLAHPTWTEAASWVQHWTTELAGTPGVMIDEFGAGDPKDQVMGQALLGARAARPDLFLAPYCLAAKGEAMIAGLKVSDLVLAETYVGDWRGYGVFDDRVGSAAAVCPDKAVAVLGLRDWATTHLEVRRQIAYLRWSRPEMPGVAFFHTTTPRMMGAVDRAVYDYFLGPALRVTRSATGVVMHNIGCLPARDVRVRIGAQLQMVPTVAPDAKVTVAGADIVVEPSRCPTQQR